MSEKTILIADDSEFILKTLQLRVQSAGYRAITALDPGEALAKMRTEDPDVIIMDINFPPDVGFGGGGTWDGFRILEWMKHTGECKNAVLIIITSEDIERHQERAAEAGVAAVFQKPIDAKALLSKIKECLGEVPVAS